MYCASPTIHRNKGWPLFLNSLSDCLFSAKFSPFHLLARQFQFILFISNYKILNVNSIQSTQHYVITAVEPLHLDGLCINFLICCLYVKFYYPWSGPLKSWLLLYPTIHQGVVSVNWFLCFFSVCSVCLFFLQVVFFIHPSVKPPWLTQYNILCHKIILVFRVSKQLPCHQSGNNEEPQVPI